MFVWYEFPQWATTRATGSQYSKPQHRHRHRSLSCHHILWVRTSINIPLNTLFPWFSGIALYSHTHTLSSSLDRINHLSITIQIHFTAVCHGGGCSKSNHPPLNHYGSNLYPLLGFYETKWEHIQLTKLCSMYIKYVDVYWLIVQRFSFLHPNNN